MVGIKSPKGFHSTPATINFDPALVHCCIMSRSNSANTANIPNIALPVGVDVSAASTVLS